jgi:hypothetical protein
MDLYLGGHFITDPFFSNVHINFQIPLKAGKILKVLQVSPPPGYHLKMWLESGPSTYQTNLEVFSVILFYLFSFLGPSTCVFGKVLENSS